MPGRMHFSPENHPFILGVNLRKKWVFTLALFMLQKIPTERLNLQNNIWRQVFLFPQFTLHLLLKYLLLKWSPRTCAPGCAVFPGSQSFPVCQSKKYIVDLVLVSSLLVNCPRLPLHSLRKIWDVEARKRLWGYFPSSSSLFSSSPPLSSPPASS